MESVADDGAAQSLAAIAERTSFSFVAIDFRSRRHFFEFAAAAAAVVVESTEQRIDKRRHR